MRKLTPREREVAGLLHNSNKEISKALGCAPGTVKIHVGNIIDKLEVKTRAEAIAALKESIAALEFLSDESAQDLVEYALIVAAVALALITTVTQLSQGIASLFESITAQLGNFQQ